MSSSRSVPAAQSAEYSPKEWPATKPASETVMPSDFSAAIAAIEVAIRAGCALRVRVRVSMSPSKISALSFSFKAASTSSNTSRADG